jgi:chemotaxis protein MotA
MNIATIIGFVLGIAVLVSAILSATGGEAGIFWNPVGLAIVLGGVVAATFICYPLKDVTQVFKSFVKVLGAEDLPVVNYVNEITYLAEKAMGGDTLKLEKELDGVENYFIADALRMLVDGYPEEKLREILQTYIIQMRARELAEAGIFRTMAKLSPAFGMVGTLIGLIVMFQQMNPDDMSGIGPAMAVAMMTTFYGVLLANLIFLPIAIKMERRLDERIVLMSVIQDGIILVANKTPPPMVMDELKAYLPQQAWKNVKGRGKV